MPKDAGAGTVQNCTSRQPIQDTASLHKSALASPTQGQTRESVSLFVASFSLNSAEKPEGDYGADARISLETRRFTV